MVRYIRYLFLAVLAICLVTVALANRETVSVHLLSDGMSGIVGLDRFGIANTVDLPLFIVIFASIVAGLLIGFVWEWLREHRQRAEASVVRRDKVRLEREVGRLREKGADPKDEVLALLES